MKPLLEDLHHRRTVTLLLLTIITSGVYLAHYIHRQTKIINDHRPKGYAISKKLVHAIFVFSYINLLLTLGDFFIYPDSPSSFLMNSLRIALPTFLTIVWAFDAREKLSILLGTERTEEQFFSGLFTFLFGPLYFNFHVNKLFKFWKETQEDRPANAINTPT